MSVTFVPVTTPEQQAQLANMAHDIWHEYWPALIGEGQTDYMVRKYQSLEAIVESMAQGEEAFEYWFVVSDAEDARDGAPAEPHVVGYTGGHNDAATGRYFISKIYLFANQRGKGYASRIIDFYTELCRERGLGAMYLTVNKHNELGTRAYLGQGFRVVESVVNAIGEGFVMDDYIMEKSVD